MTSTAWSPEKWTGHLGRKVSLRYRVHGDAEHPFSEAIGVVRSVISDEGGPSTVEILNRRGRVTSVGIDDVLAVKAFPL